ncbi:MAG: Na/Pi symporter [Candidatus Andeanibacterium colombiense]|uniref:Na/Pi symporter n=1 Tax=Candidatus Andeanibacterium colombiense TaxID=3121345 RepID=A0AAJ6BP29_9SPHN|nr:MAG: Na/Pi symporter [Sphingomonadaceae bacterium]
MSAIELLMNSLAGLGILFFGIKMVTRNLGALAGSRLRGAIVRVTREPLSAASAGTAVGFVSQSGRTTSFIMASFVHAGIIEARAALPVALWSNFGCTLVVIAAVFPIHLVALFVLALAGAAIAFERPKPLLKGASAVFGLALMLFGLRMMSQAAVALTDQGLFSDAVTFIHSSLPLAFLCGLVLTFIAQSHIAIMLITVTMARQGIFGIEETLMLVFGAHVGSSLITFFTGFNFHGQARQVVWAEVLYNCAAALLFLIAFGIDRASGGAGLAWLGSHSGVDPGMQAVAVVIAFNALTPLVLTILRGPYLALCIRLSPPLPAEELGHPRFLHNEVTDSPHVTLLLAEKEQLRLFERLPAYSAALKEGAIEGREAPSPEAYHEAFALVAGTIERAQAVLMTREMSGEDTEWLLGQQRRQEALRQLDEACFELWQAAHALEAELHPMRARIVAELDLLFDVADDAMKTSNPEDFRLIEEQTRDCGARMEAMRKDYLATHDHHSPEERGHVLALTSIYERAAWAIRRLSALLGSRPSLA